MDRLDTWQRSTAQLSHILQTAIDAQGAAPIPHPELLEYVVDQAVLWLSGETRHVDPTGPFFHRHNDLMSQESP